MKSHFMAQLLLLVKSWFLQKISTFVHSHHLICLSFWCNPTKRDILILLQRTSVQKSFQNRSELFYHIIVNALNFHLIKWYLQVSSSSLYYHDHDHGKPWGFSSCEWSLPSGSCRSVALCKLPAAPDKKIKYKYTKNTKNTKNTNTKHKT